MAFMIEDGTGQGYKAKVNKSNEMVVRAVSEPELEHSSDDGLAFSWDSLELNIDAGDTMLFVKNTGAEPLHLNTLFINGSNVICTWEIGIGSTTTTPAGGAEVTPVNLNEIFNTKAAEATARSDETAVVDAPVVLRVKTAVSGFVALDLTGIILGQDHYIQINQETESTSGSCILFGHFEEG